MVNTAPILESIIFAVIGLVVFVVGFIILDLLTPGKLWEQINEKQNLAVATFAGACGIALAIIVSAAIHV